MSKLEIVCDIQNNILTNPMTHNQRRAWMKENFQRIAFLKYVFIRAMDT